MDKIKNYIICLLITIFLIVILSFFINILNYFDILKPNIYKAIIILSIILSIFTGSYKLGLKTAKNGYLNGILYGVVFCIISIIITLVIKKGIDIINIVYYLIIIITSLIAGTIGINKKTTENNQ